MAYIMLYGRECMELFDNNRANNNTVDNLHIMARFKKLTQETKKKSTTQD